MKYAANIAGGLLGLLFIIFGLNFFLNFFPMPADPSPPEAPHKQFFAAIYPTGYLAFVKIVEVLGGILVAIPKTRNFGLVVLGPVIVNILCFHIFLTKGATLIDPVNIAITLLAGFLVWSARHSFARLLN